MDALALSGLLAATFAAAVISGSAGFGGALLLLPLLVHAVGPALAVPLLTLTQLVGNVTKVVLGWREIRWPAAGLFLVGAVPAAIVGALGFVAADGRLLRIGTGIFLILLVLARRSGRLSAWPPRALVPGGAVTGLLSGLLGSAGPVGAAVILGLQLPALAYVATEAVTAVVMHAVKMLLYQRSLALAPAQWLLGLELGVMAVAGSWAGRRWVARLAPARFQLLVDGCLLVGGMALMLP